MRTSRLVSAAAVAALAIPLAAGPAFAGPSAVTESSDSVYEIAISATSTEGATAEPQAIPAVVAGATAMARGFTAAKAPQQVSQVLRAGSFLQNFMGGATHLRSSVPSAPIDVIFDH